MPFVYVAGFALLGLVLGFWLDSHAGLGLLFGGGFGWLALRHRRLAARLAALEAQRAPLETVVVAPPPASLEVQPPATPQGAPEPAPEATGPAVQGPAPDPWQQGAGEPPPGPWGGPSESGPWAATSPPGTTPAAPPGADLARAAFAALRGWLTEGNVPVKVGVLVLFAGVAALLQYASDEGWLHLPVGLRLAGVALAAMGALVFGFRERTTRRTFGLVLQGGAIGVLVLTVFAAFRLYDLLQAAPAFALLVVLVGGTGLLAVLQRSLSLAVLGTLAGFLAPILVSTGTGNHVVLFGWYALLDLAVLAIAWFRAWRLLNAIAFTCTWGIATAWGVLRYDPAHFGTTEPFLLFFFGLFVALPVLHAWRSAPADGARPGFVEGTLVFGNPVFALALQAGLLDGALLPLAFSALAAAGIYLALAFPLLRGAATRVLGEAYAALAIGFATLAVPLGLSATASAGVFAVEGAALVWLGLRQGRLLPRASGLLLQLAAGVAFVFGVAGAEGPTLPLANGLFASAALLVGGGLASAWLHLRAGHRIPAGALLCWALLWWALGGLLELDRFVPFPARADAWIAFAGLTAWLLALLARRVLQPLPAWLAGATLALGPWLLFVQEAWRPHPFAAWGAAAWAGWTLLAFFTLAALRHGPGGASALAWLGTGWALPLCIGLGTAHGAAVLELGSSWLLAGVAVPILALFCVLLAAPGWVEAIAARLGPPPRVLLHSQVAVLAVGFAVRLFAGGGSHPLPWLPLLNPEELVAAGWLLLLATWLRDAPPALRSHRALAVSAAAFCLLTAATLRGVHHLAALPWDAALLPSAAAQTALAVVWSVLGVGGWVIGSRRTHRKLWLAGALLMGVVLAKLLLVDRQHLGNLTGIVSFLAYGLLCTVVGYLAPAPPRREVR